MANAGLPLYGIGREGRTSVRPSLPLFAEFFVGIDDVFDDGVADDIGRGEAVERDVFNVSKGMFCLIQSGANTGFEIDLGGVPGDDDLRILTEAGECHEHLLAGGVLGFVEDNEGSRKGAPAHEGEGGDLDDLFVEVALGFLGIEHVMDCVVERAEVWRDLFLEVAGEEAEGFSSLDGGAGEYDAVDGALFQQVQADGHGEVGLAGAGGAEAEGDVVFLDRFYVGELVGRARGDSLAVAGADKPDRG